MPAAVNLVNNYPYFADSVPAIDLAMEILVSSTQSDMGVAIDLDVWLETTAMESFAGEKTSHNDLLKLFADTVGSHFDPDAKPILEDLEQAVATYDESGKRVPTIALYASHMSKCVCEVAAGLIKRFESH
jgi:hypothetical protein